VIENGYPAKKNKNGSAYQEDPSRDFSSVFEITKPAKGEPEDLFAVGETPVIAQVPGGPL